MLSSVKSSHNNVEILQEFEEEADAPEIKLFKSNSTDDNQILQMNPPFVKPN